MRAPFSDCVALQAEHRAAHIVLSQLLARDGRAAQLLRHAQPLQRPAIGLRSVVCGAGKCAIV